VGLRCNLTLTQTLAADRHSRETTRIGTVFRTRTETAVFDQNRIKPKPQYFIVRDTVFTRFLVRRYMANHDVCACLSPAK